MLIYVFKEFIEIKDVWLKQNFLERRKNSYAHLLHQSIVYTVCAQTRVQETTTACRGLDLSTWPQSLRDTGFTRHRQILRFLSAPYISRLKVRIPRVSDASARPESNYCRGLLLLSIAKCAEALTKLQGCETLSPLPPFCYDMSHILPWVYKVSICLSFSCQYYFQCPE